jgi:hypothetical protein
MGFSLSKLGAPREPGNGIGLDDLLPPVAGTSSWLLSGIFVIFLWANEFGFILSDALTVFLRITRGGGWDTVSVLNGNLCTTVGTGCLAFRLGGGGKPDDSPALIEFAVCLIFGAVVNGSALVFKLLQMLAVFLI